MIPSSVLDQFGITESGKPLAGGQSTSMCYGDIVVKPVDDQSGHIFSAEIFEQLSPNGYRISRPIRSKSGQIVVEGYAATRYEPGEHDFSRAKDILDVSEKLHRDLKQFDVARIPAFENPWAYAHKVLWNGKQLPSNWHPDTLIFIRSLLVQLKPVDFPHQLVHADLGGNVLFHDTLLPLVIDFSPTVAPVEYAQAIIVCDGIAWNGWSLDTLDLLQPFDRHQEIIKYAILFRVLTVAFFDGQNIDRVMGEWNGYEKIWKLIV